MDSELQAIKDAWDKDTGGGRDDAGARSLADAYVAEHPELFTELESKSIHDCVRAVDVFRAAGMETEQWRVEAWMLHRFQPQNIGGPAEAVVRVVG